MNVIDIEESCFILERPDGMEAVAYHWRVEAPKAVLVVAHGMGEHARRYPVALELMLHSGFHIYGIDHRGHGQTMLQSGGAPGSFGDGGFETVVYDLGALITQCQKNHPGLPLILLGHSMGSFVSQAFVLERSDQIDALVLVGTSALDIVAESVRSEENVLQALNRSFEPGRTSYDWLSCDEQEVDKYIEDPLCGFALDDSSMESLLSQGDRLADSTGISHIRAGLPVYVAVGDRDPMVAGFGMVEPLIDRYRAAGLSVTLARYEHCRHELLNEIIRKEVVQDLIRWLEINVSGLKARNRMIELGQSC
ncbi:alpha/beta hydrolase [Pseudomaricurvus alkylphenolicus]|uniref:alpha/beta fold hydrolase n=1 Tax=Pseudomaricurvus alkylphenolicus TaxID=1306991 RepID=UPI0014221821|nr:alpha/beta fold hydrolase [Pseudomaricurvus alkylphenolicus]NIB43449.1 alpha/beta hydrolase [Pseudomaricurvus alkylphenolicus]